MVSNLELDLPTIISLHKPYRSKTPDLSLHDVQLQVKPVEPCSSLTKGNSYTSIKLNANGEDTGGQMAWLHGFKINNKGGLIFLDQRVLKKQQSVCKDLLVQVGSQLLSGKISLRISLPIRIFEPKTLLERVADGWNYAPSILHRAALSASPLERMKYVMLFVIGGYHFCIGQLKPFNPILGETYEATYTDGSQLYMEHLSHHPVKSAFQLLGPNNLYCLSGIWEFNSVISSNSIVNHQSGLVTIRFQDGGSIEYTSPQLKLNGILFGDRVVELTGTASFTDRTNALAGEVKFGSNNKFLSKSESDLSGSIFALTQVSSNSRQPSEKPHAILTGSWLSHVNFDGVQYWNVENEPVFNHIPVSNPLPSDVRYREDVIALKQDNTDLAQSEKLRLEQLQRTDATLRTTKSMNKPK